MLRDVQSLDIISEKHQSLQASIQKIRKFSDSIAPYFEAIGFIAQSQGEIAEIAWGAIRFILQVSILLCFMLNVMEHSFVDRGY